MLEINVAQLEKSPIGTTRDYELDEKLDIEGHTASIKGFIRLTRTNRSILVKADINTTLPQECCRCLEDFDCLLDVKFEEEYFPVLDITSGLPMEIETEDEDFIIDEHHVMDLSKAIRQYSILSIPMKPLCREKCEGILK